MAMKSEQVHAFLACTSRFERIMSEFPIEIRKGDVDAYEKHLESNRLRNDPKLTATAIRYFNLCSEEFFLHREDVIPDGVWEKWSLSIRHMFRAKWLRDKWQEVQNEYSSYPEFRQFMEGLIESL